MKFMCLNIWPAEKTAEVAAANAEVAAKLPKERREGLTAYVLMCIPQFDPPPNSMVSFSIVERDSIEEMTAEIYPMRLAGVSAHIIPLWEIPQGSDGVN